MYAPPLWLIALGAVLDIGSGVMAFLFAALVSAAAMLVDRFV